MSQLLIVDCFLLMEMIMITLHQLEYGLIRDNYKFVLELWNKSTQ